MDDSTRREIDKVTWRVLREAGLATPPVHVEPLLNHLKLDLEFYDLQNPGFIDRTKHKILVHGSKLKDAIRKIKLVAVLFYDEGRIVVDAGLPELRREFPSFHEASHKIFVWHRPYFYGDTAQSLDPDWQEALEAEANYGASSLMYCGPIFEREALDTAPEWDSIHVLKDRYGKNCELTLRRYVEHTHDRPMVMLVSTPYWQEKPIDQPKRWRRFVKSKRFEREFGAVTAQDMLDAVDSNCSPCRGGLIADFTFCLRDDNGEAHEFRVQTFNNTYRLLSLFVQLRKSRGAQISVPAIAMETGQ